MSHKKDFGMTTEIADVVIANTTIATVDPSDRVLSDAAVAIRGGVIVAVGSSREITERWAADTVIDGRGRLVTPGFVNLHVHCALAVTRGIGDDLGGAPVYRRDIPQGVLLTPEDTYAMSALGGLQALTMGSTTIVENYIHAGRNIEALADLGGRVVVSERVHDADLFSVRDQRYSFDFDDGLRRLNDNIALVEQWHNARDGRITGMIGPHGTDTVSVELLQRCRDAAADLNVGMFTHLAQTAAEGSHVRDRTGMSPVALLDKLGILSPSLVAGHCAFIDADDERRLIDSGTRVCQLPTVNAKNGWIAPLAGLRRRGTVGLGTDHMVHDMVTAMRMAVCVHRIDQATPTAISAAEALRMATINGAAALGMDASIGSIEAGKVADLLMIDLTGPHMAPVLDPVANLVYAGQSADIRTVMVGGRVVVEDGEIRTGDKHSIMTTAQATAERLWRDIGQRSFPMEFRC